jgi:colanic acid biosynthesis glycosyl transferase WcaI
LKILVVSQYFYPENFRINDLVCGLIERGHEVTVLTGQPNYPQGKFVSGYGWFGPRREQIFKADAIRVPLIARGNGGTLRLVLNYLSFAFFACFAVLFRLKGSFDLIFVFQVSPVTVGIPALLAQKKLKVPILFWVLDLWPDSLKAVNALQSPIWLRILGKMVSWIYASCKRVLISSEGFFGDIVKHGKQAKDVHYFPNWVESEYESREGSIANKDTCSEQKYFHIVYAGNIGAAQGFPSVLESIKQAAQILPEVKWIIAGNGRMLDWLCQEVDACRLNHCVTFLGQLPSEEMPSLFASADALLVSLTPDPVFDKTVPGKVQSYMAAGKPILAMIDGEGAQLIKKSCSGFVAPANDSDALVQNIKKLVKLSAKERELLGNNGRLYAKKHFERELLLSRLEGWMFEVVQEEREARCR